MADLVQLGSQTAKNGFQNELDIIEIFNKWQHSKLAQKWLMVMGYDLQKIESVEAFKVTGSHKADIQVSIKVIIKFKNVEDRQNISIKLVSNKKGFNQIDKRRLKKYHELWNIPVDVYKSLQYFCGEISPYKKYTKDPRRMFMCEMTENEIQSIIEFLNNKKMMIVSDILRGRGEYCAEWMLVVRKTSSSEWVLKSINEVMNFYGNGEITLSPRGSIKIGQITMQRKGGDGGRETANMLQFKIDPSELFSL